MTKSKSKSKSKRLNVARGAGGYGTSTGTTSKGKKGKVNKEGNPFVAFRVEMPVLSAAVKKAGGRAELTEVLRAYMRQYGAR